MDWTELPFEIQLLILTELSWFGEDEYISDPAWREAVGYLCVCQAWYTIFKELLVRNNAASKLLVAGESTGQLALEKRAAEYKHHPGAEASPAAMVTAQSEDQFEADLLMNDLLECLRVACRRGSTVCVSLCLDAGIRPPTTELPLLAQWTIMSGHVSVLELLLERCVMNVDQETEETNLLGFAVKNHMVAMVDLLLNCGADAGIRIHEFVTKYQHSISPVSFAAFSKDRDLMRVLLAHGLEIEDPEYDRPPLFWAVAHNDLEMAKMLVDDGASLEPNDFGSLWPLCVAVRRCHRDMVCLLMRSGCPRPDRTEAIYQDLFYDLDECQDEEIQKMVLC